MNTITGKVLHTESGVGIPDLIVAVYDIDPTLDQLSGKSEEKSAIRPPNYILDQLRKQLLSGQQLFGASLKAYLQLFYYGGGADQEEDRSLRTPISIAGDRIGSVITNNRGEFSLTYDDAAFQVNDQEMRPDLVLYILAPEYSVEITPPDAGEFQDGPITTEFVPVPEHLRLLHFSLFPRRNAGRLESFIIKLTSEQLERKKVTVPNPRGSDVDFAGLLEADQAKKEKIKESLKTHRQANLSAHRKIEQDANNFVQNLSAIPKALRERPLFVGHGTTVEQAETVARQLGVSSIQGHQGKAFVRLSEENLRSLGIDDVQDFESELNANGSTTRRVDLDNLCGLLQSKNGGTELTKRVPDLLRALRDQPSDPGNDADDSGSNPDDGDGDESSPSTLDIEEQIKQLVLERVQAMKLSEPDEDCPKENQVQRIKETIRDRTPPASPADVTAFYDFNHLQIAFPDVWAEAFDGNVSNVIKKLGIEYREYTSDLGLEDDPNVLSLDFTDLKEYTQLMGRFVDDIASLENVLPLPLQVRYLIDDALLSSAVTLEALDVTGKAQAIWGQLSIEQKDLLIKLAANEIKVEEETPPGNFPIPPAVTALLEKAVAGEGNTALAEATVELLRELRANEPPMEVSLRTRDLTSEEKRSRVLGVIANPEGRVTRVQILLKEMAERLQEPHSFRIFQTNTVNFGIVTTYRQEWKPGDYQVGSMVSSLPLAPGETRKYTKKMMTKKTRSQKENEKSASTLSDERAITARATTDIVEKATTTTNFEQTLQTNMSGTIGVFSMGGNTNTSFSRNQVAESQKTKNAFHEAVRKAAQEYKNERSLEVSTEEISEFESTFTSEISNPNNEITVTYLFYELERQYRITERLHKLTPVVLVAQEIPNPADIDEDWLLAHEWILRRVLLDNSFNEALDYIADGLISDEVSIEIKREHYETQRSLVEELSETLQSLASMQDVMRESLIDTTNREKVAAAYAKREKKANKRRRLRYAFTGRLRRLARSMRNDEFTFGNDDPAVLEARREALETRLGYLEGSLEDTRSQLTAGNNALEQATAELTAAIEESFTNRNLVNQLRLHVKDNILHYMQMIWTYEHPDQRYFRLYDIPVNIPIPAGSISPTGTRSTEVAFELNTSAVISGLHIPLLRNTALRNSDRLNEIFATLRMPAPSAAEFEEKRLHEIADLDNLMGFKGNYMIFPLKQCTYITDFMMQDYIDDYFGIRDPDLVGDFTTEELLRYAEALYYDESIPESEREATRAAINQLVQDRLTSPRIENELIVVPTGQLFIEALKGEHALLENFKKLHRQLDVEKVQEEVRGAQLENLRKAMRLAQDVPVMDDPDVEKKIVIEGNGTNVIVPSEG